MDSLRPKSGRPLSWTHYRILLQETSPEARVWYAKEAQERLFASKHKTCLPSEEQLREEIEIQKRFYYLQKEEDKENKDF